MVVCSHPQPTASKELQDFLLARLGLSSNALNLGLRQAELEQAPPVSYTHLTLPTIYSV